jgi:ABC-type amino acid transport substrate-binding protein
MTTVGYGDKTPRTIAGKLIGLTWMLMGVVIISLFTAFVATRLTMEQMQANLTDVSDFATVKTAAIADSTGADFLQRNGISYRLFDDIQSALTALASKEIEAVVFDRPTLRYLILQNHHDLRVLPTILDHESYAFVFPTGSPLRERVNCKLLEQIESTWWKNNQRRYLGW